MKKMMIALIAMLTIAATGKAMSYEQARNEALFLTDKMAYELNLTEEQYEAAYEINLDYLMGVTSYDDVYGTYWERRNLDLSYILLDWQLSAFRAATYFYRPLYWADGFWHFGIYARYPHRDYFFYGRPVFYASYRGGHAWHRVGGHGWYHSRRDHFIHPRTGGHFGMRDGWNRGDYRHQHNNGVRHSSTRTTVNHHDMSRNHGNNRGNRTITNTGNRTPRSLGGYRNNSTPRNTSGGATSRHSSGANSGMRSSSAPAHSNSGSFSKGSSSHSGGSFSRSSSSHGGGHSSGGGHSYGGRR